MIDDVVGKHFADVVGMPTLGTCTDEAGTTLWYRRRSWLEPDHSKQPWRSSRLRCEALKGTAATNRTAVWRPNNAVGSPASGPCLGSRDAIWIMRPETRAHWKTRPEPVAPTTGHKAPLQIDDKPIRQRARYTESDFLPRFSMKLAQEVIMMLRNPLQHLYDAASAGALLAGVLDGHAVLLQNFKCRLVFGHKKFLLGRGEAQHERTRPLVGRSSFVNRRREIFPVEVFRRPLVRCCEPAYELHKWRGPTEVEMSSGSTAPKSIG